MAKPRDIVDKANAMPGGHSLTLDQKPPHCANLHRPAGEGKPFARGSQNGADRRVVVVDLRSIADQRWAGWGCADNARGIAVCGLADVTIVPLGVRNL